MAIPWKFFLLLLMTFLKTHVQCTELESCEELVFTWDIGKWKQAYKNSNDQAAIVEFTLKGENLKSWSELVTIQKFQPINSTVGEYYLIFMDTLKHTVKPDAVYSRIINENQNSLFFEWWIPSGAFAQHEWFKIMQTPSTTMILRYTTKKLDQVDKVRKVWEMIIDSATISSNLYCK